MKTVLILGICCQVDPWKDMMNTSMSTWDSIQIEGVDTIFYCGDPIKPNTDKVIYFPIKESYNTMGRKMLQAFEWVLKNKKFDYIARINSSCFVDKKELIKYIQNLPESNVLSGLVVPAGSYKPWLWGGGQFILSKDIVQKIVDNQLKWNHKLMEDQAISDVADQIGIPFLPGKACSIDKISSDTWRYMPYGGNAPFNFTNWDDLKNVKEHFYRVKYDPDRSVDTYIMNQLFKIL